ncbi:MAG: N-acetylmuramoyl-L-alanine amidase [Clostridia bacterium]|nr:N-acetylmuramoyl-L-alanine amidase [Clostridia bacterium]
MRIGFRSTAADAAIVVVCCAILLVTALGVVGRRGVTAQPQTEPVRVLIDPGHGGADGGASAADGTAEKDINLAISLPLRDLLQVMGYSVTMTRHTDTMVNTTGTTLRERKVSDIRNRLAMSEEADMTVSIHQNKFTQAKYDGTQVFYSGNHAESRQLAEAVRSSVVSLLQPKNTRELKKGDSSVYLLDHATKPMILVECGFLSNEAELQKLKDADYQRKMAFAIAGGIVG